MDMKQQLIQALQCGRAYQSLLRCATTIWLADYVQTLPMEVKFMWSAQPGIVKVLFFLNRYLCFDIIASYLLGTVASPKVCHGSFIVSSSFGVIGIALSEAIMFVRLYALSGRKKIVGYLLGAQYTLVHMASLAILGVSISRVKYLFPCVPFETDNKPITIFFGMIVVNEFIVLGFTFYILLKKHWETRSPMMTLFYRDGVFYFIALAITSSANIAIISLAPPACKYMFVM
ncbi:hypothetical protein EST38_g13341 [Candolleomyces aberdarensis]|uniref:DUF6533 domain-containing protein n=1 Tax=Candolleomyces aberdarensis TaxID=2316362 RepID=A0A4Q2D188_9AGAR|nr:hypothetical protein EST38_g13341 [Candolleomyces aberdarensis]